jgi:hypothetical protein
LTTFSDFRFTQKVQDVECWKNKHRQLPKFDVSTDITLPCGHILRNVECHKNKNKEESECDVLVDITLPCYVTY